MTRKIFITLLSASLVLAFSNILYSGPLNFKRGQCIPATIIEPIFDGIIFMGFSFSPDSICIHEEELPIYHAIDAEFPGYCANDTIILIQFYNKFRKIVETQFIHSGPHWAYDDKGEIEYFAYFLPAEELTEKNGYFDLLRLGRSAENFEKTIKSWQLDSIADMLLYSGDPYKNSLGYVHCNRITLAEGKIDNWERIIMNNSSFWLSPSLIEQMPIEFEEDKSVIFAYKYYLNNQLKLLKNENAPIDEIKSRKFWRYNEKR